MESAHLLRKVQQTFFSFSITYMLHRLSAVFHLCIDVVNDVSSYSFVPFARRCKQSVPGGTGGFGSSVSAHHSQQCLGQT